MSADGLQDISDRIVSSRWLTAAMVVLAVGTCASIAGTAYLLQSRANDGAKARATQCQTFPISIRLYEAAHRYHFITARELATYKSAAPRCER